MSRGASTRENTRRALAEFELVGPVHVWEKKVSEVHHVHVRKWVRLDRRAPLRAPVVFEEEMKEEKKEEEKKDGAQANEGAGEKEKPIEVEKVGGDAEAPSASAAPAETETGNGQGAEGEQKDIQMPKEGAEINVPTNNQPADVSQPERSTEKESAVETAPATEQIDGQSGAEKTMEANEVPDSGEVDNIVAMETEQAPASNQEIEKQEQPNDVVAETDMEANKNASTELETNEIPNLEPMGQDNGEPQAETTAPEKEAEGGNNLNNENIPTLPEENQGEGMS